MRSRIGIAVALALLQAAMMWPTTRLSPDGIDYHCLRIARDARTWADLREASRCSGEFRPVPYAAFCLAGVRMFGINPLPYWISIVFFQAISAALVVLLTATLAGSTLAGAIAGAFYATSPIHPRAVSQILDAGNVLAVTFSLVALLAFLKSLRSEGRTIGWRCASVAFYLLAMGSKETAIPLLGVFLLLLGLRVRWPAVGRAVPSVVPHTFAAAFFIVVSVWATPERAGHAGSIFSLLAPALRQSIASAGGSLSWGVANLFRLVFPFPVDSPVDIPIYGLVGAVAFWLFCLSPRPVRWTVAIGLAWSSLAFVPGLFAYPGYPDFRGFNDRALFPMIAGAAVAAGALGARFVAELHLPRRGAFAVGCALVLALCTRGVSTMQTSRALCSIQINDGSFNDRVVKQVTADVTAAGEGGTVCLQNAGALTVRWMGDAVSLRTGKRGVSVVGIDSVDKGSGSAACSAVVVIPEG